MALFLKYRPQVFQDLVGQTSIVKTLQNAVKADTPAHAYLFCGSRGTGKTSMARIMAKALNCPNQKNGTPCNDCTICKEITEGNCVDVIEIDAASNRGINEIREIRDKVAFSPSVAKRKVYIIDEVHMLTKEAFNALLKTLEEPPAHAYFVLATTELHKVPETIISRCQTFLFQKFTLPQLVERLEKICKNESFKHDTESLDIIARKAEGGLRDAISLLEQIAAENNNDIQAQLVRESLGISSTETLEQFWEALQQKNANKGIEIIKTLSQQGSDFRTFGHDFLAFLREKMYTALQTKTDLQQVVQTIEAIEKALTQLKTSPIVELPLEIAVITLCHDTREEQRMAPPKETPTIRPKPIIEPTSLQEKKSTTNSIPKEVQESAGLNFKDTSTKETEAKNTTKEEPKQTANNEQLRADINLNAAVLKERMKQIATNADIPGLVRKSFTAAEPTIENNTAIFTISSEFHYEKLRQATVQTQIKKSLHDMFNQVIPIEFRLNKQVATKDDFKDFFAE